ncbi:MULTISPECIES: polysaccharide biosynthesis/export family protein [Olivibacter]|jgi:polysaccharide export outer membrane protein|uniref:Polysaccharide biosynthesis/export family protein n=1 Tax=Olivibacter oleidegradans TaxID=760123 RepID=A0ABV6HGP4_9SPHI|nr:MULTISPECIES: polysaccharide biosynthesis/export family protein [Olivibacter]
MNKIINQDKKIYMKKMRIGFFLVLIAFLATACQSNKTIPYFKNIPKTEYNKIEQAAYTELKIKEDDILDITIQTADVNAASQVNDAATNNSIASPGSGQQRATGFVVDKEGEVELPVLGRIKLEGLTSYEARNLIRKKANEYFVDPTVQVRFVNFKVTVIGEVNRPSSYTMPSERVTILDAIGLAGDLTIYGKRENVLLIRETNTGKELVQFNLNDSQLFKSPYYYLKQNDIIYVEPSKGKIAAAESSRFSVIAIIASLLSTAALIITRL